MMSHDMADKRPKTCPATHWYDGAEVLCERPEGHAGGHQADSAVVGRVHWNSSAKSLTDMHMEYPLEKQREWSQRTFGPGPRTKAVIDHVRKELAEVEACDPEDNEGLAHEWVDVVILALDGLMRAIDPGDLLSPGYVAEIAAHYLTEKFGQNTERTWPDWRTADPDKAIEHKR